MKYTITLGKGNNKGLVVELYVGCPLDVPAFVSIGIGNRQSRYKDWLNSCLINENNDEAKAKRLRFLAFIHKVGIEKGSIHLYAKGPLHDMQVKCVSEFLIENSHFLDNVLPYLFKDVINISDKSAVKDLN